MSKSSDKNILTPQCPIRTTLEMLGGKWRLLIIKVLSEKEPVRYRDIKAEIPEISDKVLSDELKTMEENHLILRDIGDAQVVTYTLTSTGKEAVSLIEPIAQFGLSYKNNLGL